MKKLATSVIAAVLIAPVFAQKPAESAASLYKKGVAAEQSGDPATAGNFYGQALKADPNHADARYSLAQLKINYAAVAAKGREAKIGSVMIPVFQVEEATLQESLDALSQKIETESKGEVTPNFVIEDPKRALAGKKISLNLKNLPARGVLKYLVDQAGAKVRYDEHAVVVTAR